MQQSLGDRETYLELLIVKNSQLLNYFDRQTKIRMSVKVKQATYKKVRNV